MRNRGSARKGRQAAADFRIVAVNRDDDFKIAEGLSLQAIECLGDEIGALVERHSHSDARIGQIASPPVQFNWRDKCARRRFPRNTAPW